MGATPAYEDLVGRFRRIYRLEHFQSLATWDRMTMMPAGSAQARAEAQGELAVVLAGIQTSPEIAALLNRAEQEPLAPDQRANLLAMQRQRIFAAAIPDALLQEREQATSFATQVWVEARKANDWPTFAAAMEPVVQVARRCAMLYGEALALPPYEALLERYQPGLRIARMEQLFGDVSEWLPGLIKAAQDRQSKDEIIALKGPFAVDSQKELMRNALELLGFSFGAGRLDVSAHPFCGGVPEDVRITTRYNEADFFPALLGVVHETGHARYQQNLPREWAGQPLGEARCMALHESQSLSFERELAPQPGFAALLCDLIRAVFNDQPAFTAQNIARLMNRVQPGKIRVEADPLTYPAHILLRVEIERGLIDGSLAFADLPALWDERMRTLLGVDTVGDFANGAMQDIHWPQGMFGYFPSYLLGAMIAAQLAEHYVEQDRGFPNSMSPDDVRAFGEWLKANVWAFGAQRTFEETVAAVTGAPLSADALRHRLTKRYLGAGHDS
jgi:carboxypeptidase Taq